jgi:hypothetical protein
MRKLCIVMLASAVSVAMSGLARAADDPKAVLEKGIKALGGEEKLAKFNAYSMKSKGKFYVQGSPNDFTSEVTVEGLDHSRSKIEGEFNGEKFEVTSVLAGDKGWSTFPQNGEMDADRLAHEKRNLYLQILPGTLSRLKDNAYKFEAAKEEQVDGKPAVGVKITGPGQKDFILYFDKESGLPVKLVGSAFTFMGEEVNQEVTYGGYKDFEGIKRATKVETKHNGEKASEVEVTEFKVLDRVDPKTFSKPD